MSQEDIPSVVLDSCVLFPASLRDLLMSLAVNDLFAPKWTERIHQEWIENLLEYDRKRNDPPRLERAKLERTRDLMNVRAEGSLVENYEGMIEALALPDPNDRHVLAAAIESGASAIITFDLHDFPAAILAVYNTVALHPDAFLCERFDSEPEPFLETISEILVRLTNPPRTREQYAAKLENNGLRRLAQKVRSHPESPAG